MSAEALTDAGGDGSTFLFLGGSFPDFFLGIRRIPWLSILLRPLKPLRAQAGMDRPFCFRSVVFLFFWKNEDLPVGDPSVSAEAFMHAKT